MSSTIVRSVRQSMIISQAHTLTLKIDKIIVCFRQEFHITIKRPEMGLGVIFWHLGIPETFV